MSSDNLKNLEGKYESIALGAGSMVVLGLALEVGLAVLLQQGVTPIERWAPVFANILVAAGVFGEIFFARKARSISEKLELESNERVAASEAQAAEANERAQKSETARIAMLNELKPRDLTVEQIETLAKTLRGHFKEVYLAPLKDAEASRFMRAIAEAINRSGANAILFLDTSKGTPRFWSEFEVPAGDGLTVYASNQDKVTLLEAFVEANLANLGIGGILAPHEQFKGVPTPIIFVGLKRQPFSQFPAYAAPPDLREHLKNNPPPWAPQG